MANALKNVWKNMLCYLMFSIITPAPQKVHYMYIYFYRLATSCAVCGSALMVHGCMAARMHGCKDAWMH